MVRRRDLSTRDVSDYTAGQLDSFINQASSDAEEKISVSEALAAEPVFEVTSNRDVTRVLFITTNTDLINPVRQSIDGYTDLSNLFQEVHISVLRIGIPPKNPVLRAAPNVWIYTAASQNWWQLPAVGRQMVDDQLSFANGFRPDLIVARDPVESAWLASQIAKKYQRPAQLHVVDDFTVSKRRTHRELNWWQRQVPYFTIPRFRSIRTQTDALATKLSERFDIPDLDVLPRLQNYESLLAPSQDNSLSKRYHGISVFLLYVGPLTHDSGVFTILESVKFILKNKRIGLVIIGDGPAKQELKTQTKQMNIADQVIFESENIRLKPFLKGAHMIIVPETSEVSERIMLKAAAAGIPMLLAETEKRLDIFDDKYSAYFIDKDDSESIASGISDLLNDVNGRQVMAKNAQEVIKEKFYFDIAEYQEELRLSIEAALFEEIESGEVSES